VAFESAVGNRRGFNIANRTISNRRTPQAKVRLVYILKLF
jgi:hypothetical protein